MFSNIPTTLESIEESAFNNCDAITSIELPNSFRTVGVSAFFGTHTHIQTADEHIMNNMAYMKI